MSFYAYNVLLARDNMTDVSQKHQTTKTAIYMTTTMACPGWWIRQIDVVSSVIHPSVISINSNQARHWS